MDYEKFEQLFNETDSKWDGDNALQGLLIIAKYMNPKEHDLITGADHDVIYSVGVQELIDAGITEEDVVAIAKLNWSLQDDYLSCFV